MFSLSITVQTYPSKPVVWFTCALILALSAESALAINTSHYVQDPGVRPGPAGAGGPLPGLGAQEIGLFNGGQSHFTDVDAVANDLGPGYNANSCAACHAQPAVGGSTPPVNPQVALAGLAGAWNSLPPFITLGGPVRVARFVNNPDGTPDCTTWAWV